MHSMLNLSERLRDFEMSVYNVPFVLSFSQTKELFPFISFPSFPSFLLCSLSSSNCLLCSAFSVNKTLCKCSLITETEHRLRSTFSVTFFTLLRRAEWHFAFPSFRTLFWGNTHKRFFESEKLWLSFAQCFSFSFFPFFFYCVPWKLISLRLFSLRGSSETKESAWKVRPS